MAIKEESLKHWIENFYGYGSWKAKVWFVNYEENGGDTPEEVAEKINYFKRAHAADLSGVLCDIRELYKNVRYRSEGPNAQRFDSLFDYRFGTNAMQNSMWKNLIAFTEGYREKEILDPLSYQQQSLASIAQKKEAFIQLYPLPSTHNHAWYYSWVPLPNIEFLRTRAQYEAQMYETRMQTILNNVKHCKPEVVLMFGMKNINEMKKSVRAEFPEADFATVKGTKLEIPQHHKAELDGTQIIITTQVPVLRHNRVETGFDWRALGKSIATKTR
jgi:hypothetical protein